MAFPGAAGNERQHKRPGGLRAAIDAGATINVVDATVALIAGIAQQLGRRADVCMRVLPFSYAEAKTLPDDLLEIATDRSHDKWGMDRQTILEVVPSTLADSRLRLRGSTCTSAACARPLSTSCWQPS